MRGYFLLHPGPYFEKEDYYYHSRAWGRKVQHFAKRVAVGDIVVLKRPHHRQWEIQAAGKVTDDYEWLKQCETAEKVPLVRCKKEF